MEYFQLSQRGGAVAWLTGALFGLDDEDRFQRDLRILADALDVSICAIDSPLDADDALREHDRVADLDDGAEDYDDEFPNSADADGGRGSISDLTRRPMVEDGATMRAGSRVGGAVEAMSSGTALTETMVAALRRLGRTTSKPKVLVGPQILLGSW